MSGESVPTRADVRRAPTRADVRGAPTRAEVCVIACAEAFRGDGEILASPFGPIPSLGARLARLTFEPDLVLTDGEAALMVGTPPVGTPPVGALAVEAPMPYRKIFDVVWSGRRHVMMMATQIDRYGNQNISCIGDWACPRAQLVGVRGAPGNTMNHATSYWVPRHSPRSFVERVDMVCGVGSDRAREIVSPSARFHDLRVVVTNLAVLDFTGPGGEMSLRSVHPGVTPAEVQKATGFELHGCLGSEVPETRLPTPDELELLRGYLDPEGLRETELA